MPRNILLTGATGALGPHLAAQLLAANDADQLSVLIRHGANSALQRFKRWSASVSAIAPVDHARLHLAPGDVASDGMGLDRAAWKDLARQTDIIIHAAADTRFRGCPNEQWNVNVEGTRRMLEFAAACPKLRQFILVSTICVAGNSAGLIPEAAFTPHAFINHYERTKWHAEQLVLTSSLPARIARIGIVMGSHATGAVHRLGALHHVLRWFGRGMIPLVPGTPDSTVELIDVEMPARFLAKAASDHAIQHSANNTIWNVTAGDRAARLDHLMDLTWQQFNAAPHASPHRRREKGKIVDAQTFSRLKDEPGANPMLGHLFDSIESFLPGLLYPRLFQTTAAQSLWGAPLPIADWRQTLRRVIRVINAPQPRPPRQTPSPTTLVEAQR